MIRSRCQSASERPSDKYKIVPATTAAAPRPASGGAPAHHCVELGALGLAGRGVAAVDRTQQQVAIPGGDPAIGVLGLEAPRLRSTTEDKVWSELESLPR